MKTVSLHLALLTLSIAILALVACSPAPAAAPATSLPTVVALAASATPLPLTDTPVPPTATRTATRKPTAKPAPTNTLAPVGCIMLLKSGGQGRVSIINNYAGALTLKVADKTYAIPGNTADLYIDVGQGEYVWTAVAPGMAGGMGPLVVMSGWKGLRGVFAAAAFCGLTFAATQFTVSNFVGPQLTDILSSLAAMTTVFLVIRWNHPRPAPSPHNPRAVALAWAPYALLVVFVLLWGYPSTDESECGRPAARE